MTHYCPICNTLLQSNGPKYTIDQLLELWKPIKFTQKIIEEHRVQSEYTQLYTCPNCELDIFLPQIIGTPQFYIEAYNLDKSQDDSSSFTYNDKIWEFDESIKDILKIKQGSDSLLEFGCGNGHYLDLIKKIHMCAYGVEYNNNAIQIAKNKGLNVVHVDDINQFLPEIFDIVVSFHVLEHVEDPLGFIKNMMLYVRPGGKIYISVPNQDGPVKYIIPCHTNMPPHHATRCRKKTFEVLAEKLNLKIEKVAYEPLLLSNHSYYSYYWVNLIFGGGSRISRIIRQLLNKSLSAFFIMLMKLGFKYFWLLKGQSVYVVFKKPDTSYCVQISLSQSSNSEVN